MRTGGLEGTERPSRPVPSHARLASTVPAILGPSCEALRLEQEVEMPTLWSRALLPVEQGAVHAG